MSKHIDKPHDLLFHDAMSNIAIATSFFMTHLPADIQQHIDLSTLRLCDGKHVSPQREASHTDILYEVKINGVGGYLSLHVEHQSTADPLMPFRMLRYLCRIMEADIKKKKGKNKKLPLIIPVVYYHGKQAPYPYTTDIIDCFEQPELAKHYFLKPFHLIDLTQIPDNELVEHDLIGALELTQKHIFERDFLHVLDLLLTSRLLSKLANNNRDFFLHMLQYIAEQGSIDDEERFFHHLNKQLPEYRGDIMTVAQQLENRGLHKGMQQGMQQKELDIAKNLLRLGQSDDIILQATGIDKSTLESLRHND